MIPTAAVVLAVVCFMLGHFRARGFTPLHPPGPSLPDLDHRPSSTHEPKPFRSSKQAALQKLKTLQPDLHIDFDPLRQTPRRIIAARGFLTGPNGRGKTLPPAPPQVPRQNVNRPGTSPAVPPSIRAFLDEHRGLFGYGSEELDRAALKRQFTAPNNGLRTVVWEQRLDDIAIHEGVFIGHETRQGELVALSSLLVPDPGQAADRGTPGRLRIAAAPPISAAHAIRIGAENVGELVVPGSITALAAEPVGREQAQSFRVARLPGIATARLIWLPLDEESLRLCWRVEISRRAGGERYQVFIDATTEDMILRRRLTIYLTDATYRVFTGDSPTPFSPGWPSPNTGQPPLVDRSLVTWPALDPNASPLGWISDADNETRGNNVTAHTDRDADDEPDLPRPTGSPFHVFDSFWDPLQPSTTISNAAVIQLFYWCNWAHDRLYQLGFDEAAGNFQKDNLGRGGLGADAIVADAMDGSGLNNANFTPSPDGEPGRIQMFVWDGPEPDRAGEFDAEVVLHEYVHGLSTRLVGGGVGISTLQAAGLGEGWSDFYALSLLSKPDDDIDGIYPFGGYVAHQLGGLTENYYFGIRQYPYCTDLQRQPLTLRDIDPLQAGPHDGIPRNPLSPFNPLFAAEVHAQGEVWCATLWDARANLIRQHGAAGNEIMLQLVTDGMKLSPPNPNFLEARDAILLADQINNAGVNQAELWRAFARRGMGWGARVPANFDTVGVSESYETPDALSIDAPHAWNASGPVGGPFTPTCFEFSLTNLSSQTLRWAVQPSASWVQVSPPSGALAPGFTQQVTACLTSNAQSLSLGAHLATLWFTNRETQVVQEKAVDLRVMAFRTLPFEEDFETGEFDPAWLVSGTGLHRAQLTTLNGPHGGKYHLTLDADAGVNSRNELTLGLDLAGYTNVTLRYWARSFGDEPNVAPAGPFAGGADFDGIAISDDGVLWHEIQSWRDLTGDYRERIVSLDAAITAKRLHYTRNFHLRFNQFDDYQIPFDGVGLDDIRITGAPARRIFVTVPTNAMEGAGELTGRGRMRLGAPAPQDVLVTLHSSRPTRAIVPVSIRIPVGADEAAFTVTVPENTLLDGTEAIGIVADAAGYTAGQAAIEIFDNETATLRVSLPPRAREGDGLLRRLGTVQASPRPIRPVAVRLQSSAPAKVKVPAVVILEPDAKEAEFAITVLDDDRLDGMQSVRITAQVENWREGAAELQVLDNDEATLMVDVPGSVSEGNGHIASGGIVRLAGRLTTNLIVSLTSSAPNELRVAGTTEIPAGMLRAPIAFDVLDDPAVDGPHPVTITAHAAGFHVGSGSLVVLDDETPTTPYQPQPANGATNVALSGQLSWQGGRGELITNGGFELGDLSGWSMIGTGFGAWVVNDGKLDPDGPEEPSSPLAGRYNAVTVQNGAGRRLLFQDVFIPSSASSAVLNWTDRIHNHAAYFSDPNQEYRVDILDGSGAILATAFRTVPSDTNFFPTTRRTFDLGNFRGQTIRVLFSQQDDLGYFNVGLDDVSVRLGAPSTATEYVVYLGRSSRLTEGDRRGVTTNEFWTLPPLELNATYYWQVVARRGLGEARGPVWRFTTRSVGEIVRFDADTVSRAKVGERFALTATARDDIGNAVNAFTGPARLIGVSGSGNRSRMLITEVDVGPTDRAELANASDAPVDLSGWTLTLFDARSWPQPAIRWQFPAGIRCPPKEVLVLDDIGESPGEFPNFHVGTNISWNAGTVGNPVAVLLQDAGGATVDFVALGNAQPDAIRAPRISGDDWTGPPINVGIILENGFTAQRRGWADTDSGADWEITGRSIGDLNADLHLPFSRRGIIPVTPSLLTNFTTGVWNDSVTVAAPAAEMILEVSDTAGHRGVSQPFAITAGNDLAVIIGDTPDMIILGDSATFQVGVTNAGTARATNIVLTNRLAPEFIFVRAETSDGACSNVGALVICEFAEVPPAGSVRVEIRTDTWQSGIATNRSTLGQRTPDAYPANDVAMAWTTITGPFISTTNVVVNEGTGTRTNVARFPVWLSAPCRFPVTVHYLTTNLSARAGRDYLGAEGTLEFPPGVTNLFVPVIIIPDTITEVREQFALVLDTPTHGVIVTPFTRGRIDDDDPMPRLNIADAQVLEGASGTATTAEIRLELSSQTELPVSVSFATVGETARAPSDYRPITGVATFSDETTNQVVRVTVRGDNQFEPDERLLINFFDANSVILVRTQAVVTIVDDDSGEFDRLEWSAIPSPQYAGYPMAAGLTARDGLGRVVTAFNQPVTITAIAGQRERVIGEGTNQWAMPFGASFHDSRLQLLFLPEELGGAGNLNALTFELLNAPGQTLSNWIIRLKQTERRDWTTAGWENDGWTTVLQQDLTVAEAGTVTFIFTAPFPYNGVDGLLMDLSFNNSTYSSDGLVASSETDSVRALYLQTDSAFGDPLTWTETYPPPVRSARRPNVRLHFEQLLPLLPATPVPMAGGDWQGSVTILESQSTVMLRADDGRGRPSLSRQFVVAPGLDSNGDGVPDAWELERFAVLGTPEGRADADPDDDGQNNREEFEAGTDPRDRGSVLRVASAEFDRGILTLTFPTRVGRFYQVEIRNTATPGAWRPVGEPRLGTGEAIAVAVSVSPLEQESALFFRVRVTP